MLKIIICFVLAYSKLYSMYPVDIYKEHKCLNLISQFLKDDSIIVVAGANFGAHTKKFSKIWPDSVVISFEPHPEMYELMLDYCKKRKNVLCYPYALAEKSGKSPLYVSYDLKFSPPKFNHSSSLLAPFDQYFYEFKGETLSVEHVNLEEWCCYHGIPYIDLLWINIEGMELQVLKSCPNLLKTIPIICVETTYIQTRQDATKYEDLEDFLLNSGFKLLNHWYINEFKGKAIFLRTKIKR